MLDELFVDELIDDPDPLLVEEPHVNDEENEDKDDKDDPNAPSADAVRVVPKRKISRNTMVTLNYQRVIGPRGINCIQKSFKNVNLKGKGHELSDLNTVLGHLEHWANRMYPKANFDDTLKKLEVIGRKRPVQVQMKKIRMGWEDDVIRDSNMLPSDEENNTPDTGTTVKTSDQIFDDLLATQTQRPRPLLEVTQAQEERMLRNRKLAEEKRMARMKAEFEKKKLEELNVKNLENIEYQNALISSSGQHRNNLLEQSSIESQKDNVFLCSQIETGTETINAKENTTDVEMTAEPIVHPSPVDDTESEVSLSQTDKSNVTLNTSQVDGTLVSQNDSFRTQILDKASESSSSNPQSEMNIILKDTIDINMEEDIDIFKTQTIAFDASDIAP